MRNYIYSSQAKSARMAEERKLATRKLIHEKEIEALEAKIDALHDIELELLEQESDAKALQIGRVA